MKFLNVATTISMIAMLQACSGAEAPEQQAQANQLAANDNGDSAASQPSSSPIIQVPEGDLTMEAAKKLGRESLSKFAEKMANPADDEDNFGVKFNLTPDSDAEFIWASDLEKTAAGFTGLLANDPMAAGFEAGQSVEIAEADVIDWGYTKNGVMQGHFTTRVLINDMPEDQASQYREMLGW